MATLRNSRRDLRDTGKGVLGLRWLQGGMGTAERRKPRPLGRRQEGTCCQALAAVLLPSPSHPEENRLSLLCSPELLAFPEGSQ